MTQGTKKAAPLQHLTEVLAELAAELGEHPDIQASVWVELADGRPHISIRLGERAMHEDGGRFVVAAAAVLGAEVWPSSWTGLASAYARDWRGTGVSVSVNATVAERRPSPEEATSGE